jgi:uncharacterized Zn finger protein
MYRVAIEIRPLAAARWTELRKECAGRIDSLVALLEGRLPAHVMEVVTREGSGLFPTPKEIALDCSCPDSARLCKHVAAVLYGVGVRLDEKPELLFRLRNVDHRELVSGADALFRAAEAPPGFRRVDGDLSSIFGIEIAEGDTAPEPPRRRAVRKPATPRSRASSAQIGAGPPAKRKLIR